MTKARSAQEAVVRADAARREAKANRRAVFTREYATRGRSYQAIAIQVGLSKSRVSQIINGRDR